MNFRLLVFGKGRAEGETATKAPKQVFVSGEELFARFLLIFVLVLCVLVSCLAVIMTSFEYRQLFNRHQELVGQRDELQVEWGQLLLEQSAWAANNRVEQQAVKLLSMQVPEIEQIEIVTYER